MKKIILPVLFLLPFVMISCQKEVPVNTSNAINVTAQDASDQTLKTAFINTSANWIAGTDHIGLYSDRAYTTAPGTYATNVDYTAQSSGAASAFSSSTAVYWDGTANVHNFYAYYPYASGTPVKTVVPITLPENQVQDAADPTKHIGDLDFTVATPLALTPAAGGANPTVAFTFNHVFTILKFDITCANPNTLTQIRLTKSTAPNSSLNNGTIDITQPNPGVGVPYTVTEHSTGTRRIILTTNMSITSTAASAYMLILPGNSTGTNNFDIFFTAASGRIYDITKSGINFERGKVYTITVPIPITGANAWR